MNIWHLVHKELTHRKLGAALAVLSIAVAVGLLVAQVALLRDHDHQTETVLAAKQDEIDRDLARMQDEYRKYMLELGFNVLILPQEQDVAEFWRDGHASHTMDEQSVSQLARSGTTLIRHLLPIIQQKVHWPEKERTITLVGTRGEVPIMDQDEKKPMLQAVPDGKAVFGHQLASDLSLKPGDVVTMRTVQYEVLEVRAHQGGIEDATVWVSLGDAQRMLGLEGRINAIEALKCHCASAERETIQGEIEALKQAITAAVPGVQAVVRENRVVLRAKARHQAQQIHEEMLAKWQANRAELRREREQFASLIVPLVIAVAAMWIAVLTMVNVRERRNEIGVLRAIGVCGSQIFALFISKALLLGVIGAALGICGGVIAALVFGGAGSEIGILPAPQAMLGALVGAPLLAAIASLAPAVLAARQDPALILSEV